MDKKLYRLMDWAEIEAVVYGEHDHPKKILGARVVKEGVLFTCYYPDASRVLLNLQDSDEVYEMEMADEMGFFAFLLQAKRIPEYFYTVIKSEIDENTIKEIEQKVYDSYSFESTIDARDLKRFESGIHYEIFDKMGAHEMHLNGVNGVDFVVWAPNAQAICVVCNSSEWNYRMNLMERIGNSGIFELFIPGLSEGEVYKFAIKGQGGSITYKSDPYAFYSELRPDNASIVYCMNGYEWNDSEWMLSRQKNYDSLPMSIYEVHAGSFIKNTENDEFCNYRDIADKLVLYLKDMNYTHVELMPLMEHPLDESLGYQVTGYYAATSRYGTPEDLMYFIDTMHAGGIGVIMDWVPAYFPKDQFGLADFDGTCLYEHCDTRKGETPDGNNLIFNYGRPQVANFLIGSALFWLNTYHLDGLRIDNLSSMLYLDYGRAPGEWVPNIYGNSDNLEALGFFEQLMKVVRKQYPGVLLIAEETAAWPEVTDRKGLGFDYKWNTGWNEDFLGYFTTDYMYRKNRHNLLTESMLYNYSERFILALSHDTVSGNNESFINRLPGSYEEKFADLRTAYGYMMTRPGKKLLFMGQDIAQFDTWNCKSPIQLELTKEFDTHRYMRDYIRSLNEFYRSHPALYEQDFVSEGFEWLSTLDAEHGILTFLRIAKSEKLLIVCNFSNTSYELYKVGVPSPGKYKELFNSDRECFGGSGFVNPRVKFSKSEKWDGQLNMIKVNIAAHGIEVFSCQPENTAKEKVVKDKVKKVKSGKNKLK